MLANSSKYAIRALHHLRKQPEKDQKLLSSEIAKAIKVPKPFLSKLLKQMAAANFVSSKKGRKGGFFLTEKQLDNSILDIIILVEGKDRLKQCALNLENCNERNVCSIHHLIAQEKENLRIKYASIRVRDLL